MTSAAEYDPAAALLASPVRRALVQELERHAAAGAEEPGLSAAQLAPLADLVFQTVTFAHIATASEDGSGDFTGTVARLTSALLDLVR